MTVARYFNPRLRARLLAGEVIPWLEKHCRRDYIINAVLSAPYWADREEIRALRVLARQLTDETGVKHVLDHIVPITHPYVCGLTVSWNLRVVPHYVNAAKSNRWNPDQLELSL